MKIRAHWTVCHICHKSKAVHFFTTREANSPYPRCSECVSKKNRATKKPRAERWYWGNSVVSK